MPRLPNAPEVFVGRAAELRFVAQRLRASPLTLVWGPPGIGKTGLAVVATRAARAPQAIYVSARDSDGDDPFLAALERELVAAAKAPVARARRGRSRTEIVASILEVAERAAALVVVDDVDSVSEEVVERLLLSIARYGDAARFLVLSRVRPRWGDLADKTLRLDPLGSDEVRELAERCLPAQRRVDVETIVARAAGSPHRTRLLALGHDLDGVTRITDDLPDDARRTLFGLCLLRIPVALAREVSEALDERGLVRLEAGRARLDDALRAMILVEVRDRAAARASALGLLEGATDAASLFERLRLLLDEDEVSARRGTEARALLDERADELFVAGYAAPIFALLERRGDRSFDADRRACAAWLQGGPALSWALGAVEPSDARGRLAFSKLLAHGGQLRRASAIASELARRGPEEMREDALLLLGDLERHAGEPASAVRTLEGARPRDAYGRAERDLRLATALVASGQLERARSILDAHPEETLEGDDRRRLVATLGGAWLHAGRFRELERVLGDEPPAADARASELFLHLALAVERGHVARGEALLRRVGLFVDESAHLRFAHAFAAIRLGLVVGPLDGVAERARALSDDPRVRELPDLVAWAHGARAAVQVVLAPRSSLEIPPGTYADAARALIDAWGTILAARRGETTSRAVTESASADVQIVVRRARAEAKVGEGDLDAALAEIEGALAEARTNGLALEEVGLLSLRVDVELLRRGRAPGEVALLREAAEALGSARFAGEARLGAWLGAPAEERDPATLLALAADARSPIAQRRASAIAGRDAALDALDARVVALAARHADAPSIVLDLGARAVRLPSGQRIDLGASELTLRLLETLARAGGRASKELLAKEGWQVASYHPHRDDRRLHVAIHRMRGLLDSADELIVRDGDGYRVAVPMRVGPA